MDGRLQETKNSLRGVYTIVATPMKSDYSVDLKRLAEQVSFIIEGGIVEGKGVLVPIGAGGEGYHLTEEECIGCARTVIETAGGRVPVFPGCMLSSTSTCARLCSEYQKLGADGVQLSPPYYYEPSEEEYLDHYRTCAESAPELGIVAYNSWWNSIDVQPDTLGKLTEVPNVIGIKWSSPSAHNYRKGIELYSGRFSFIDNQITHTGTLGFMLGTRGFVSSVPNFAPGYDLQLLQLLEAQEWDSALVKMREFIIPLYEYIGKMYERGLHGEGSHWKACCEIGGRAIGPPRPPHRPYTEEEKEGLREIFRRADFAD